MKKKEEMIGKSAPSSLIPAPFSYHDAPLRATLKSYLAPKSNLIYPPRVIRAPTRRISHAK